MGSFKHYLPAANGAELKLLEDLAREHKGLIVHSRQNRDSAQLFFEADSQPLASFIWYLLARLRRHQRQVEEVFLRSSGSATAPHERFGPELVSSRF